MKSRYQTPRVTRVEVPRPHILRVVFEDGAVRELEFIKGNNEGTLFEALEDPEFFERVRVDRESRTVVWPNDLDLDPAVLRGDFPPAGKDSFRDVSSAPQGKSVR